MDSQFIPLGRNDVIEVTVKRKKTEKKGQKHTSPTANSVSEQKMEKKKSTFNNNKNWSEILTKQNKFWLNQTQCSQHCKTEDAKKNLNVKNQQKNCDNHMSANPSKRTSSQKKKFEERSKTCCSSVLVQDRAVQHPEICNNTKFASLKPTDTLDSLMKELKDLVKKDKKACEVSNKMEQMLLKISANPEHLLSEDIKIKLKDSKAQMEDSGEKIKKLQELWKLEKEKLQSKIREHENYIKEVNQKQADLENHAKKLNERLEDVTRIVEAKDKTISILKQQIENSKSLEIVTSDLKEELFKQTELVRKNDMDNQYLTLERDKWLELSCHKDELIEEYKNAVQELQNRIGKLFENEVHIKVLQSDDTSVIQSGRACSSPTSSFSNHSTESWHDLSNISSVRHESAEYITIKEDTTVKDSAHLELVSLLDGESSHSYQNQITNDKGVATQNNNNSASRNLNTNSMIRRGSLFHSLKKDHNKENDVHKTRKFSRFENIQNGIKKDSFYHDATKILESIASNKIPVNVPSPVRDFPHPSWSDTSFPSVSTATNLDVMSSKND